MILLKATTETLEILTSQAVSIDYSIAYVDITTTTFAPSTNEGNISTATTTTVLSAPSASTQRQVKLITVRNRSTTTAQQVTFKKDISATEYYITPTFTLSAGDTLQYIDSQGWKVFDVNGVEKVSATTFAGYKGITKSFYKVGTASEAIGNYYCYSKDTGNPGAWVIGTPGLAGRTTDGTTTTDAGCIPYTNPVTGSNYLTKFSGATSVATHLFLRDILWVNSGLVVTTTTAQTINSVAFPARDDNGSTNGEGVYIGLLVTTATTNAALNSTMTVSYTNSDGTAGRTATVGTAIDSFPATAVIGTFVPFKLQAGDRGVRSIQTITLAVSLTAGAVSLIAYRDIDSQPMILANVGTPSGVPIQNPGVKLYNGSCIFPFSLASATTLNVITGTLNIMER